MPLLTSGFGDILGFGIPLHGVVRRVSFNLAGRLVLGQVEFLLDLALAAAEMLVMVLLLERCTDFCFEFLCAFVGVRDVRFQLDGTFFKSLDRCFQRSDRAQRSVSYAGCVASRS